MRRLLFVILVAMLSAAACTPAPTPVPDPAVTDTLEVNGQIVTVTVEAGLTLSIEAVDLATVPSPPPDREFPLGAFAITIGGVDPDQLVDVTVQLPVEVDSFRKLLDGVWDEFVDDGETGGTLSGGGDTITLTLVDGGRGDADGVVNGTIADPLAPVFVLVLPSPPIPTCFDSATPGWFDALYVAKNQFGNLVTVSSDDGTCSGAELQANTVVVAGNAAAATGLCSALDQRFDIAVSGEQPGISPVPVNLWACVELVLPPPDNTCMNDSGVFDFLFLGDGFVDNVQVWSSTDGTCSGEVVSEMTAVTAATLSAAIATCQMLEPAFNDAIGPSPTLVPHPGSFYWACNTVP